jgi:hypothetical protein
MKGFWIPVELMELNISWTKRILLAEISQLEMLDKGCVASNAHFSHKLKLTTQAVSKALNELAKDGFIEIDNAQTKRNFGRKITINFSKSPINFSKSPINFSVESKEKNKLNNSFNNIKSDFTFSLKKLTEYKNLSKEYKDKLKDEIETLKLSISYDDFIEALEAKGYSYKNFLSAYKTWCKKDFNKPKQTKQNILLDLKENSYDYSKTDF